MTVMAATPWRTNGELVEACRDLGYLRADARTLDPTYGRGIWWSRWSPRSLVTADLYTEAMVRADFTALPFAAETFDAVTYDPPYVCIGGRKGSGMADMHDRFGMIRTPTSPAGLQQLINGGLRECERVLKPKGYLLVKCQDYISSGKLWLGTHETLSYALWHGLECVDRLEHTGSPRPQPPGRRQVHARRNLSTLFVLRKASA